MIFLVCCNCDTILVSLIQFHPRRYENRSISIRLLFYKKRTNFKYLFGIWKCMIHERILIFGWLLVKLRMFNSIAISPGGMNYRLQNAPSPALTCFLPVLVLMRFLFVYSGEVWRCRGLNGGGFSVRSCSTVPLPCV